MDSITNLKRLNIITNKINNKEQYIDFLRFTKKFYELDFKNQLLIYHQNPNATKINTFIDWKKENRNVKKNPRKIFLYGYYNGVKNKLLDGQLDIKGKERKSRKIAIEEFNGNEYRRTCNYDICDTYIDRKKRAFINIENSKVSYSNNEILNILKDVVPFYIEKYENIEIKDMDLKKFIRESVEFQIANYFNLDTEIYEFQEYEKFYLLDLVEKVNVGEMIQNQSKDIINTIIERIKNKTQICA